MMLSLIACVVLIATAAQAATVNEYSDDAIARFSTISANSIAYPSTLTAADNTEILFKKEVQPWYQLMYAGTGLFLFPEENQAFANIESCTNFFGITLITGATYCNATLFSLNVADYEEENDGLTFVLEMESAFTTPFRVEIPVFKIPDSHAGASPADLQIWAEYKQVGLVSPLTDSNLESIRTTNRVSLKFDWLADVLKFGLSKSDEQLYSDHSEADFEVYVSRPIVLPAETVQNLLIDAAGFSSDSDSDSDSDSEAQTNTPVTLNRKRIFP